MTPEPSLPARQSKSRRMLKWNCTKYHFINLPRKSTRRRKGEEGGRKLLIDEEYS